MKKKQKTFPHTHTTTHRQSGSYLSRSADLITSVEVSRREGSTPSTLVSAPLHAGLISLSLTFYLSRSLLFFHQRSQVESSISPNESDFVCVSPALPSPSTSLSVCHPGPLSQGDPASQSPLSLRPGPLLILLHLSCLFPPLWLEFMTVP